MKKAFVTTKEMKELEEKTKRNMKEEKTGYDEEEQRGRQMIVGGLEDEMDEDDVIKQIEEIVANLGGKAKFKISEIKTKDTPTNMGLDPWRQRKGSSKG